MIPVLVAMLLLLGSSISLASEPEEESETRASAVDYMIVTGTRITRRDYESASPIVTVMPELFESIGAPTVEAALNQLPQFVPDVSSTSNNPGNSGQANLNLRGLGPTATLVLLDGRRMMPSNGTGVVDVNLVPPSLIERVEIVSGGASAVYGSDAVAGVVNFRLKQSFEGVEVGGTWGQTDRGDGEQWNATLTAGTNFAGGRGSIYGFVGRSERDLVTQGDRGFSRYALNHVGDGNGNLGPNNAFVAAGSVQIEEGATFLPIAGPNAIGPDTFNDLFAGYGYTPGSVPLQPLFGFNEDGSLFTLGNQSPNSVANLRGEHDPLLVNDRAYGYNFAPPNALQLPLQRTSAFSRLSFDLSPAMRLYADGLFADYTASQRLAPTPILNVQMPRSNPFVPADLALLLDSRPSPNAPFVWLKRASELGPRVADSEYSVYQGLIGLEGYVGNWRYDAYVQYGENKQTRRQSGNALRSRIDALTFAPDGGLAACGGFDIFGRDSIPGECASFIAVDASDDVRLDRFIAETSLEGPLLELPAGELRTAFGLMHKRDGFRYTADPVASQILPDGRQDIVGFFARDDIDGEDYNTDVYIEMLVPLFADRPGVRSLEAGLGYRHSQYDQAGGADAWKLELLYRPIDSLRLRGSFQKAIRAPSITELFSPQLPATFFIFGQDPCEATNAARTGPDAAAVEALCIAQGVPAELMPNFVQVGFATGFGGGNPELHSEEAETWTVGLVWSPAPVRPHLGRLQAALDWYRIDVDDAIQTVPLNEILAHCFNPHANPEFSPDQPWCTFFARNPDTGEIIDAFEIQRNLGRLKTSGIDLQLDWSLPLGPGTLGVNWLVTWLDSFERGAGAGAPVEDLAGEISYLLMGTSLAEWRALLSLSYGWRNASVTARSRYIDAMRDTFVPEYRVPGRTYLDLFASYEFGAGLFDGLRLGFGIENVTDRDPPIFPSYLAANTDPQLYDVLGRRYFATFNYRF